VLAAAALGNSPDLQLALRYAVLVELIHAGALFHDDVTDRSTLRRGQPTLWSRVGDRAAVLAGEALIVRAGGALAEAPESLRRQAGETLRDVARGQTDELMELFSARVSPEAYIRRARAKTGALYELSARLGAAAGGLDARTTEALGCFASTAGLAFQLADDVRDLVGDAALGRPPGTDLRVGVYTLPILLTTSGRFSGGEGLSALLDARNGCDACVTLLTGNGAIEATVHEARRLRDAAITSLAVLPASPARAELERTPLTSSVHYPTTKH